MQVQFDFSSGFEKDVKRLGKQDQRRVESALARYADLLSSDPSALLRSGFRPHKLKLPRGLDSSLYSFGVSQHLRILMTVDDDPIFDQFLVTLLRVVHRKDLRKAFSSVAESLYQAALFREPPTPDDLDG